MYENIEKLKQDIINVLEEKKAVDISILKVDTVTSLCDYFIVCEGTSFRHMKTLSETIIYEMKKKKIYVLSVEGLPGPSGWILLDYGSVIVNIMTEANRDKYDIESLWNEKIKNAGSNKMIY